VGIATDVIYIVLAALIGGALAHVLRQPLACGYILAGLIVGPYTGGFTVQNTQEIEKLAEIGVALLLFTLGLEFSFGELKRLARITLLATPLQILLCSLAGYGVALCAGVSPKDALWIGGAISLSSTMVVLKTLAARDALDSREGRIMLGILIAQDLAVVPLMLVLPQLTHESVNYGAIVWALGKSVVFLGVMYFAGTRLLPRMFTAIANQGSRELFFLSTLGFALGAGFVSHQMELSFALGAFVAGMLLSDTDFNHQALSDVSHLRDLFAMIFFVSVGMLFDPNFFVANIVVILALVGALLFAKAVIISGIVALFGYGAVISLGAGLGLAQVGEFAFVVVNVGRESGEFSAQAYSLMIAVTVVSMVVTPALFGASSFLTRLVASRVREPAIAWNPPREHGVGHVVVIGAGVVGRYIARVLSSLERPYVVIESDYKIALQLRDSAVPVVFGDATRRAILDAAGVATSSLVVITSTNDQILPVIVGEVRRIQPGLPVVVRVEEVEDVQTLSSLSVDEIVQPQFEVGLEMVRQSLLALKIDESQIFTLLGQLRADRYETTRFAGPNDQSRRRLEASRSLELLWFEVEEGSELVGLSLQGARLRERFGVSVVGVMRGADFIPSPSASTVMVVGDALAVLGTKSQFKSLQPDA
jgi:CPA2 family monovalent cation:H+ antiporter-2